MRRRRRDRRRDAALDEPLQAAYPARVAGQHDAGQKPLPQLLAARSRGVDAAHDRLGVWCVWGAG